MKRSILIILMAFFINEVSAQIERPVRWSYFAKKVNKTEAILYLKATIGNGWHIYSQTMQGGTPLKTMFSFSPSKDYILSGKTAEPKPTIKYEKILKMNLSYFERQVVFQQKIKLKTNALVVKGVLDYTACNESKCLPSEEIAFSVPIK